MIPDYENFEAIGEGGWAQVFRAVAPDGRPVAVKVMRPALSRDASAVRRFEREGRTLRALEHAAIPKVLALLRTRDARPALVMELVAGRDLRALIAAGPSPWPTVAAVGVGVARALDHAHARGVIHRDIKPSNVMLADGGDAPEAVRVLDFGVAFRVDETRITRASHVGTESYMAPEQRAGAATLASDLYSLGVTLYHLSTGRLPEAAESRHAPHDAPRDVPADLESLLREMRSADPLRRPASAREVEGRLLALGRPASAPTPREALGRLAEQLRAKAFELRAQRNDLERLSEDARDGALSSAEIATRDALRERESAREQAERDVTRRMAALDVALAALDGRREA